MARSLGYNDDRQIRLDAIDIGVDQYAVKPVSLERKAMRNNSWLIAIYERSYDNKP